MSEDGPRLVRPIPRRPFDVNFISPTPPSDNSSSPSPRPDFEQTRLLSPKPNASASNASSASAPAASDSGSISRTQSIMNLTSSTLFGIYSPTSSFGVGRKGLDREEPETPWGTGAQTPVKRRSSIDESTYELMRDRSTVQRRRTSRAVPPPPSATATAFFLFSRVALLFVLGMGYGALITRLHRAEDLSGFNMGGAVAGPDYAWPTLAFWGVSGVLLGALQPWFDRVWADTFGAEETSDDDGDDGSNESRPGTDWAMAVRSIGAFVGIVFAIRRLPWASTLQVSLTLALVNPFLWYLIDRSKPGFLLSAAVGLTGSAVLLGVNPDMMPTPSGFLHQNSSATGAVFGEPLALGGFATQETLETGIWMLSVLFCSCVCFGNIGRRLALSQPSVASGRWAGVK
ncbi:INSIG domain-containing protein [Plectosphaerella cucumerina]|uniref:INSIG domain-containing protein n=1 Tax=Plectosphaerella cucumerina TaxID=40658 RepID=A0A8K0T926_9PEZI|nr:INSIG domain-containing protein [Plectosphaerella cucumerina]